MRFRVYALVAAIVVAFAAASCGGSTDSARTKPANARQAAVTSGTNYASTDSWKNAGQIITQNRKAAGTQGFGPYLSQPIDVTAAGDYTITIGPLSVSDAASSLDQRAGFTVPGDATFSAAIDPEMSTFTDSAGNIYGKFTMHVTNFRGAYEGLTVWAQ
jgi:hypothetical protein